jgi:hypothetical protein
LRAVTHMPSFQAAHKKHAAFQQSAVQARLRIQASCQVGPELPSHGWPAPPGCSHAPLALQAPTSTCSRTGCTTLPPSQVSLERVHQAAAEASAGPLDCLRRWHAGGQRVAVTTRHVRGVRGRAEGVITAYDRQAQGAARVGTWQPREATEDGACLAAAAGDPGRRAAPRRFLNLVLRDVVEHFTVPVWRSKPRRGPGGAACAGPAAAAAGPSCASAAGGSAAGSGVPDAHLPAASSQLRPGAAAGTSLQHVGDPQWHAGSGRGVPRQEATTAAAAAAAAVAGTSPGSLKGQSSLAESPLRGRPCGPGPRQGAGERLAAGAGVHEELDEGEGRGTGVQDRTVRRREFRQRALGQVFIRGECVVSVCLAQGGQDGEAARTAAAQQRKLLCRLGGR